MKQGNDEQIVGAVIFTALTRGSGKKSHLSIAIPLPCSSTIHRSLESILIYFICLFKLSTKKHQVAQIGKGILSFLLFWGFYWMINRIFRHDRCENKMWFPRNEEFHFLLPVFCYQFHLKYSCKLSHIQHVTISNLYVWVFLHFKFEKSSLICEVILQHHSSWKKWDYFHIYQLKKEKHYPASYRNEILVV